MKQQRHSNRNNNRKGKRSKQSVVDTRWENKEDKGRIVKENNVDKYLAPPVQARNPIQKAFLEALQKYDCVVLSAPAGVGKSFLTMSECSDWLKKGIYNKLYLTRPAVGMGNTVGLLKGGIREKYEPYLLPLVDVLCDRYGRGFYEASLANGTIEYCLLEYIRGRNISEVVIVDEFQNTTPEEAYTILTRIADGGCVILIGDPTQTDIRGENGMQWLPKFVEQNPELREHVKVIYATSDDIERGGLCKKVVKAKERSNRPGQ